MNLVTEIRNAWGWVGIDPTEVIGENDFGNLIIHAKVGQYCLVIPGVLGGSYDVSNIKTVSLIELIRFSGDLGKQIRDLPDGAQIELKVID